MLRDDASPRCWKLSWLVSRTKWAKVTVAVTAPAIVSFPSIESLTESKASSQMTPKSFSKWPALHVPHEIKLYREGSICVVLWQKGGQGLREFAYVGYMLFFPRQMRCNCGSTWLKNHWCVIKLHLILQFSSKTSMGSPLAHFLPPHILCLITASFFLGAGMVKRENFLGILLIHKANDRHILWSCLKRPKTTFHKVRVLILRKAMFWKGWQITSKSFLNTNSSFKTNFNFMSKLMKMRNK